MLRYKIRSIHYNLIVLQSTNTHFKGRLYFQLRPCWWDGYIFEEAIKSEVVKTSNGIFNLAKSTSNKTSLFQRWPLLLSMPNHTHHQSHQPKPSNLYNHYCAQSTTGIYRRKEKGLLSSENLIYSLKLCVAFAIYHQLSLCTHTLGGDTGWGGAGR